ncbi:Deoxyadenosine kinase / Deoxyguanosine kinase [Lactococcus lactis subsp. lactis bv. diacetylactis]|uniref:Deoxyadenosine kinase / Deoxyguanosine kinase n=1 Tax=Lactococcus lactis subsp. lactis TaxID=1360 RepID=A0A0V8F2Y4_LACLL|nr:Deoxyadenosine kinase / Deoxyguanosine kinase [Lactococcus lactis subsp. lactis]KZK11719.1 Deoxyadenosine kinase / Deoxyguanosine kinase [Lactococcus lactis subsp. lactis bv. diacetylactis]CDI46160.1 Deoxyadenosine kinase / Deoxyguanosine kinase [Lactococcus lactis subsp. lactis Dephy 1]KSU28644.1 Deoxyadenosine kinase / Deoxyguanosine kinase [Lactococcus lactis subsp. lactis]KSU29751.1 Deoxyadenosine kinase / Deoxyguanosine kinase [Lactococcus lactis subsp. lactis]
MLVLAGTIGAGKSSLTEMLAEELKTQAFYESVDDNKVLPLFYENPQKYAFLLQIYFLNKRFDSIKRALSDNNNVLDRSIYEDSLLFHLNADLGRADETEVEVYDDLLNNMLEEIDSLSFKKRPDLLIHVKVSFDKMLERIKKRGRQFEQLEYDPSLYDYYKELNSRYDTWFEDFDICPKIQIDGDKYDFVEDEQSKIHVLQQIKEKLKEIEGENN